VSAKQRAWDAVHQQAAVLARQGDRPRKLSVRVWCAKVRAALATH
jgi:hypothetical protein